MLMWTVVPEEPARCQRQRGPASPPSAGSSSSSAAKRPRPTASIAGPPPTLTSSWPEEEDPKRTTAPCPHYLPPPFRRLTAPGLTRIAARPSLSPPRSKRSFRRLPNPSLASTKPTARQWYDRRYLPSNVRAWPGTSSVDAVNMTRRTLDRMYR